MHAWPRQIPVRPIRQGVATLAAAVAAALAASGAWIGTMALPPAQRRTLAYAVRTMLAIGLALFTAFSLQLQSPMSSVVTVLIVANPNTGALVSKSLWRLFGTVLGAAVAVALMAAFAQSPLLFTAALSSCIGVACVVSTLLRYFRAYGAVLAGYTVIIVAAGSFDHPPEIFVGALSRVSAVSVGIVSAALVFLLGALPFPATLAGTVEALVRDVARGFAAGRRADGPAAGPPSLDRTLALLARVAALDEAIEYASADSYALRRRADRLRVGAARLLGLLSAMEPLHGRDGPGDAAGDRARGIARDALDAVAALPDGHLATALPHLRTGRDRIAALAGAVAEPAALALLVHERDVLDRFAQAIADLADAGGGTAGDAARDAGAAVRRIRLRPFLEWSAAGRNGLRGLLVTLLGGLAWYVTRWSAGPVMLSFLIPAACLLSTSPLPSRASVEFATGTILAIGGSALFQTLLLPRIAGFPLLWASLCLCLAPGIWLQHHPRHRNRAFGYVVFFGAMVGVRNQVVFDDVALLNGWLAFLLGALCLMMVFRVLLPPNPPREVRRLAASLGRAVELLSWSRDAVWWGPPDLVSWQNQQMQKVPRLIQRLRQVPARETGADAAAPVRAALAIVALGRSVLALQGLRRDGGLPPSARDGADAALRALRRLRADPGRTAARLDEVRRALEATDPEMEPDAPPVLLGTIGEAAALVRQAGGLLRWDRLRPARAVPAAG